MVTTMLSICEHAAFIAHSALEHPPSRSARRVYRQLEKTRCALFSSDTLFYQTLYPPYTRLSEVLDLHRVYNSRWSFLVDEVCVNARSAARLRGAARLAAAAAAVAARRGATGRMRTSPSPSAKPSAKPASLVAELEEALRRSGINTVTYL